MRDATPRVGFCSRLIAVSFIALAAACASNATAQKPPAAFKTSPADCFKYPLTLPNALWSKVASDCEAQFNSARKFPDELANAGLHSGTALNNLGQFNKSASILERVIQEPRTSAKTRDDARFQLAVAYSGQAAALAPTSAERPGYFTKTIDSLEDLLKSPNVPKGSALYNSAVYQLAVAYQMRGGGSLDYTKAIDNFEVLAASTQGVDAGLKEKARVSLIEVAKNAGAAELKQDTSNVAGAERASALYEKALKFDPRNAELNMGLGDARLVIARTAGDKTGWYSRARDAYSAALNAGASGAMAASANLGLARASRGLGQLREAAGYYKAAESADSSNFRIVTELGETQVEYARGLPSGADKQQAYKDSEASYRKALGQAGLPAATKASLLITLADVQGQQPNRVADVQKTLQDALAADPGSVGSRLELAKTYYAQSMFNEAKPQLTQVVAATGGEAGATPPGQAKLKADAFHYLSLIESRDTVTANAVKYADLAVKVGGRETPYREQACIAHILRGDKAVTDPGNSAACTGNDQPEGLLLSGMFYLRYAQYAPPAAKAALRDAAKTNFQQGLREATRQGSPAPPPISFTRAGASTPPAVADLLKYGTGVAEGCSGLTANVDLNQAQYDAASSFYTTYRVNECRPN